MSFSREIGITTILILFGSLYHYTIKTDLSIEFQNWKLKHGIIYSSELQETYRLLIYSQNIEKINTHNRDNTQTYKMGANKFTDLSQKQFEYKYLLAQFKAEQVSEVLKADQHVTVGDIDWVARGAVTGVKNQGSCTSCWAFAAIGTVQGFNKLTHGILKSYSSQQLIDCSTPYGNLGCNGGMIYYALNYIRQHGINQQQVYPYVGQKQQCKNDAGPLKITKYSQTDTCTNLDRALSQKPVAVAVDAANWALYSSGVFSNCKSVLNYNALLVGLKEGNWVVKNVWGTNWGEQGYIRLKGGNTCGICNFGFYPTQ